MPTPTPSPKERTPVPPRPSTILYSLWDHSQAELEMAEYENTMVVQLERITNFLQIPRRLEKLLFFGNVVCLDSFLHTFTILPARIVMALGTLVRRPFLPADHIARQWRTWLSPSQQCDLMKGLLIAVCCGMLQSFDSAQLYHMVRGQLIIKVYAIFNMLEVFDWLCSAFGQDILDTLFSKASFLLHHAYNYVQPTPAFPDTPTACLQWSKVAQLGFYVVITAADIVKQFQIMVSLTIITLENGIKLSVGLLIQAPSGMVHTTLPFSFAALLLSSLQYCQLEPIGLIIKFNTIRPETYGCYADILCHDLASIEENADCSNELETTPQSSHPTQAVNPTTLLPLDQISSDSAQPLHPGSAMRRTPSGGRSKIRVEWSLVVDN
ncbi:hypothetical protein H4R35_005566 [Dimargaris xerosporica]|nr:hypothetical protein H4R35_005566 [Dimargaris xerosporica]